MTWQRFARNPWEGLVGVERAGDGFRVVDARAGETRAQDKEGVPPSRALADLVRERGLRGRPAAALLEGNDVHVRRLSLPPLRRPDLLPALTLECRKHVPYPLEEAEIRFEVLGPSSQIPGGQDVLVAVAPRRAADEARVALEDAGLRPVALTIRPVAIRALVRSAPSREPEIIAFLDMGARASQITVLRGDEIRFARDCGVGVASFVDALRSIVVPGQGTVALGAEEAERLLFTCGVPRPDRDGLAPEGVPLAAVSVMLRPTLERLVRELWNSLDYVHEQFQGEAVTRVRLMGGAAIPGLAEHLAGILKIPVDRADTPDERGWRTEWTSAAGLARLVPGGLNFLEPAGAGVAYRIAEAIPQKAAVLAAAVLLVSVALPVQVTLVRERQRVQAIESEVASIAPQRSQVEHFRAARRLEERSRVLHARLSAGTPPWSEVLRDLSHRVGKDARLVSVALVDPERDAGASLPVSGTLARGTGRMARIDGFLRRDGYRSERELAELMSSLERSPWWMDVRLVSAQAVGAGRTRFTLEARISEGS